MISILIKGMKMPKKCEQCWFFGTDSARVGYCYLLKGELPLPDGVPQDCPLVEVPTPHGRLIDADAILGKINAIISAHPDEADLYEQDAVIVRDWLRSEPTVIEREKA